MNIYFGENLKELRLKKNLTQEKLAEFLGVSFQTISKWERCETYPDITMLPEIARYFKISVDDLLGINKAENEAEIEKQIQTYDNLTDKRLMWELISSLKEKFPNDFRVLIRYMACLVRYSPQKSEAVSEVLTIYHNIQQNCNDDQIRIISKRAIIEFYHSLSKKKGSVVSFDVCEDIISQMPRMRDSKEMFCFFYPENHPKRDENIRKTLEEGFLLLHSNLEHYYFFDDRFDLNFKLEICKKEIELLNFIYNDGNYGKMWRTIISAYGHLAVRYFQKGDTENALLNLNKCAELAKQFDGMERITVMRSELFEGKLFDKHTLGSTYSAKNHMKELMNQKYPFSDEFKSAKEFQEIVCFLDK